MSIPFFTSSQTIFGHHFGIFYGLHVLFPWRISSKRDSGECERRRERHYWTDVQSFSSRDTALSSWLRCRERGSSLFLAQANVSLSLKIAEGTQFGISVKLEDSFSTLYHYQTTNHLRVLKSHQEYTSTNPSLESPTSSPSAHQCPSSPKQTCLSRSLPPELWPTV